MSVFVSVKKVVARVPTGRRGARTLSARADARRCGTERLESRMMMAAQGLVGDPSPTAPVSSADGGRTDDTHAAVAPEASDLAVEAFGYAVTADATGAANGPLPVNEAFTVTVVVKNLGAAPAPASQAAVYVSADGDIDPQTDYLVGTAAVPALAGGQQALVPFPPSNLPQDAQALLFGRVYLGVVADSSGSVSESDESNNRNRGDAVDRQPVRLYDRTMPTAEKTGFPSARAAQAWLLRNRFTRVPAYFGGGWARRLPSGRITRSPYDGRTRSGDAYRQQAFINAPDAAHGHQHWILLQGSTTVAEPNPATALSYGLGWTFYVADWHNRF